MNFRIKEVCKKKGLTMEQLAGILNVTPNTLTRNINGNPTVDTLQKIANALGVPFTDLFTQPKDNTVNCPYCGNRITLTKDGVNYTSTPEIKPAKAPEQSKDKEEQQPGETGPIP